VHRPVELEVSTLRFSDLPEAVEKPGEGGRREMEQGKYGEYAHHEVANCVDPGGGAAETR